MEKKTSGFRRRCAELRAVWDESAFRSPGELPTLYKIAHFCLMVWRSFTRNRCPVRATALAYGSLLAMIPMLAVVMSITSTFLKKEGEERIDEFITKLVASLVPPAAPVTNAVVTATNELADAGRRELSSTNTPTTAVVEHGERPGGTAATPAKNDFPALVARRIHQFIQNTRSGALGVTGSIVLIFAAISLVSRIEDTFNDIWGVERGRSWFMRIVLYWGVISLAPMLLVVALALASGPHLASTRELIIHSPFVGRLVFQFLPVAVLCFTFAVFYMLMPNTKVNWRAAATGGLVGGLLFHLNNVVSVLYVSRVVSNSKIYGSLGLVPVFMIGLYFSWLILLFGAQVAYAFQNRATYLEEKQIENINQRGREFVALRLMALIGQRFLHGDAPPKVAEMGCLLSIPTRLIQQILETLGAARLVVEAVGADPAFVPARPLESITCHDILLAMRAGQGQELATREEPARAEVYGEFQRIQEAERQAASSVTMLALANRTAEKQITA